MGGGLGGKRTKQADKVREIKMEKVRESRHRGRELLMVRTRRGNTRIASDQNGLVIVERILKSPGIMPLPEMLLHSHF